MIIGISAVCASLLIIMLFLPMLKGSNHGYNTKTEAVILVKQQDEDVDSEDEDEAEEQEQAPAVTMNDETAPEEDVATEADPTIQEQMAATEEVDATQEETAAPEVAATQEETPATEVAAATPEETKAAEVAKAPSTEGLYSVVDGNKLDEHSYNGFKQYRNWCARCHGTYGQGMVGPNLADSLNVISKEQFYDTVENGKSGRIGSMPSWNANPQVMENRDQIYAYLKARSDGAIGEVKPKKQ